MGHSNPRVGQVQERARILWQGSVEHNETGLQQKDARQCNSSYDCARWTEQLLRKSVGKEQPEQSVEEQLPDNSYRD